ncbi:MAG: type II secretion system minor pseudopilin GspJ [Pseudomonadota bacterium]
MARASTRGFTLIEMIVALGVFAILGAMTAQIVGRVVDQFGVLTERGRALTTLNRAMQVMQRDLLQINARTIRDPLGDVRPAVVIQADGTIEFTRAGWANPLNRKRSTLQRVVYRLEGDILYRAYFLGLDLTPESEPLVQELLTGVSRFEVFALDAAGNEYPYWPAADVGGDATGNGAQNLAGVALRFEIEPYGELERIWAVPELLPQ